MLGFIKCERNRGCKRWVVNKTKSIQENPADKMQIIDNQKYLDSLCEKVYGAT